MEGDQREKSPGELLRKIRMEGDAEHKTLRMIAQPCRYPAIRRVKRTVATRDRADDPVSAIARWKSARCDRPSFVSPSREGSRRVSGRPRSLRVPGDQPFASDAALILTAQESHSHEARGRPSPLTSSSHFRIASAAYGLRRYRTCGFSSSGASSGSPAWPVEKRTGSSGHRAAIRA